MVINLFIGLILISAASTLITQGKRRKIWSILLLIALCGLSWMVVHDLHLVNDSGFIYQWLPYPKLQADFNISASLRMQQMLTPMLYLLAVVIVFNIIDVREGYSLNISGLNLLSFIMIILLASGHDLFQLMFASALLSIICFYIPDDAQARHKLFIYNFLAEMACFTALSVVYSAVGSISLNTIESYGAKIPHKDFVACLLLFSFGCKSGLILLNGHYNALASQSFNRLCSVFILSLPVSSLILLSKLSPLISDSFFSDAVKYWCLLSFVVAGIRMLITFSLNSKIIASAQMFYAGAFYDIYVDGSALYTTMPKVLSVMLLFLCMVYYMPMSGLPASLLKINKLLRLIMVVTGFSVIFLWISDSPYLHQYWTAFYYAAIVGFLIRSLVIDKISTDFQPEEKRKFLGWIIILALSVIIYMMGLNNWQSLIKLWGVSIIFSAISSHLYAKIGKLGIWNYNFIEFLYDKLLIVPLKFFGRILWLAFDFVFIERGVIGSAASFGEFASTKLRNLQNTDTLLWLLWLIIGGVCLTVFAGVCAYD